MSTIKKLQPFNLDNNASFTFGNVTANGNIIANGNISALNANLGNAATANFFIGNGSLLTGLPAGYTDSNVAAYLPTYTGNLTAGNTVITGNLTVTGTTVTANVTSIVVKDPIIEQGGDPAGPLSSNDGKDRGQVLHYYTTTPVDAFMGWDSSNAEFAFGSNVTITSEVTTFNSFGNIRANLFLGNGSALTSITGANVSGAVGLATYATTANAVAGANVSGEVSSATTAGTVTTAAQPNITSTGTLTSLTVSGNTTSSNANITANLTASNLTVTNKTNLGSNANITITGGTAGYALTTDGTGNLSWSASSGGAGGGLTYTAATTPPASGNVAGDQWFNTTANVLYEYINDGTSAYWVDVQTPTVSSAIITTYVNRSYTGDGSTATYTVTSGCDVNNILVFINGVCQMPTVDYTVSGSVLTLIPAAAAAAVIQVRELPR